MKTEIITAIFILMFVVTSCDQQMSNHAPNQDDNKEESGWLKDIKDWGNDALKKGEKLSEEALEKIKSIEINGFSVEDDITMGKQLYDEIHSSNEYEVMDRKNYVSLYSFVENIKRKILSSEKLRYKDDFEWKITLLRDDSTVNAFCAPGGYIFIYSGILKYLDNEAELAGVMAHEMGHADRRHGTRQMTKSLGITTILDFLTGGSESTYYKEVINGLISLRYSRHYEREADECSVKYLCSSEYASDGAAGFFEKILQEKGERSSELLSTHPDPAERISNFNASKKKMQCKGNMYFRDRYLKMKKDL